MTNRVDEQSRSTNATAMAIAGIVLVVVATYAVIAHQVSIWWLVAAAIVALLCGIRAQRARDAFQAEDALSPWRSFRAAKRIVVEASSRDRVTLQLDLTHEWVLEGEVVRLRFDEVENLVLQQPAGLVLHFDFLVCQDRGTATGKRPRYRVHDRWKEVIEFDCSGFEALS